MKTFEKNVYEMLTRVQVFVSAYPQYFPKESLTSVLMDDVMASLETWRIHETIHAAGKGDGKLVSADRAAARQALKNHLEAISATAKGLNLTQFWMSRDRSDRSLVEIAAVFADRAKSHRQRFIDANLPPDFIERLEAVVQTLQTAMRDQVSQGNACQNARAVIDSARTNALSGLAKLDALMENLLRDNAPALLVWRNARRVERYSKRRGKSEIESAASPPLVQETATASQNVATAQP